MDERAGELTERCEILMTPDMKSWVKVAARRHGLSPSGWHRMIAARELTNVFGTGWQDHPEVDLEQDAEVTAGMQG